MRTLIIGNRYRVEFEITMIKEMGVEPFFVDEDNTEEIEKD